jgi:hypothetical protein
MPSGNPDWVSKVFLLLFQRGFPKVHYFGTCGKYIALVMDLLGPNLV